MTTTARLPEPPSIEKPFAGVRAAPLRANENPNPPPDEPPPVVRMKPVANPEPAPTRLRHSPPLPESTMAALKRVMRDMERHGEQLLHDQKEICKQIEVNAERIRALQIVIDMGD